MEHDSLTINLLYQIVALRDEVHLIILRMALFQESQCVDEFIFELLRVVHNGKSRR